MRFTSLCTWVLGACAAAATAQASSTAPSAQCGQEASTPGACQWGDTLVLKPASAASQVRSATLDIRVAGQPVVRVPLQALADADPSTGAGSFRLERARAVSEIQSSMASEARVQVVVGSLVARTAVADVQVTGSHAGGALPSVPLKLDLTTLWSSGDIRPALHGLTCLGGDDNPGGALQRCPFGSELRFNVPGLRQWWPADKHPGDKMTLVLNGVVFKQVPRTPLVTEPPSFSFELQRGLLNSDAVDPWSPLLAQRDEAVPLEVSLGNDKGEVMTQARGGLVLQVGERMAGTALFTLAAVVFGVAVFLRPAFLRDAPVLDDMSEDEKRLLALSLGRTQMFFWTLFVMVAWAWLWWWTGSPFSFNQTALVLIGISAATAVGASAKAVLEEEVARLKTLGEAEAKALRATIIEQTRARGAWSDLSSNAGDAGTGLHRVQVMAFTLLMGAAFAISVVVGLAMPHFPETALALMGISGSIYVGFKFLPAS